MAFQKMSKNGRLKSERSQKTQPARSWVGTSEWSEKARRNKNMASDLTPARTEPLVGGKP